MTEISGGSVINVELETGGSIDVTLTPGAVINAEITGRGPQGPQGIAGQDGADGAPGTDGADGFSPVITSEAIAGGHRLTIVDADGTTTVDVMDGQNGADGQNGQDGQDGTDGVSPEVTIAAITGGHSVTITDADHPTGQTFNVMDGEDGQDGQDGQDGVGVPSGGTTGQVLKKKSGTDYDTEWGTVSSGSTDIFWCTYGTTTSAEIETALAADQLPCVVRNDVVYVYGYKTSATKHYFASTGLSSQQYQYLVEDNGTWNAATLPIRSIPSGGNAGQVLKKNSATDYDVAWTDQTQFYPSAYCSTAAGTAAKKAACSLYVATANSYLHVLMGAANTYAGAITLNVNSAGAKPIYINGAASSATNYTLPAGTYIVFYDGTNYYFRTDGKLTANITGNAANGGVTSVNGQTGAVGLDADDVGAIPTTGIMYFTNQTVSVATSAEIMRITNANITADTVVLECVFANPSYITSDVEWTSYDAGYIAFTGTCSTATTANIVLGIKGN